MKRSLPSGESITHLASKRRRTAGDASRKHHQLRHRQPNSDLLLAHPQDAALTSQQLSRAIVVALYAAGFTSVQNKALESFQAAVQEYMLHFAQRVTQSMHSSRRLQPLPQDFIHALAQFNLTPSSLLPDLSLRIPPTVSQPPILPPSPTEPISTTTFSIPVTAIPASADAIDPSSATQRRRYVPPHFPSFPSQHAYKSTAVFTTRETDARRIRELATAEGMEAEKALRKLVAASKAKRRRQRSFKDSVQQQRSEEVWRETLEAVRREDERGGASVVNGGFSFGMDGAGDTRAGDATIEALEEMGAMVNYDRMFWRRGNRGGPLAAT